MRKLRPRVAEKTAQTVSAGASWSQVFWHQHDKECTCNAGDLGWIPRLGRSPGGGHGNPLQYSCLENPMDKGAWRATVHGVTKTQTRLSNKHSRFKCVCKIFGFAVLKTFSKTHRICCTRRFYALPFSLKNRPRAFPVPWRGLCLL